MVSRKVSRRYFGDGENDQLTEYELLIELDQKEWTKTGIMLYAKTLATAYDQGLVIAEAAFDGMNFGLLNRGQVTPIEN